MPSKTETEIVNYTPDWADTYRAGEDLLRRGELGKVTGPAIDILLEQRGISIGTPVRDLPPDVRGAVSVLQRVSRGSKNNLGKALHDSVEVELNNVDREVGATPETITRAYQSALLGVEVLGAALRGLDTTDSVDEYVERNEHPEAETESEDTEQAA